MTRDEAKQILALYRPGRADADDPPVAEALRLMSGDAELKKWFAEHCAYQDVIRTKLRSVEVPPELRDRILAERKIIEPVIWFRQPLWLGAAAALLALLVMVAALWRPARSQERLDNFRSRMVAGAQRSYHMDIVTNDMTQIRQYMANQGAPADYEVTPGLARLQLTGGGRLQWRGHPVSMVCFARDDGEMLFLFVLKRDALDDAPPPTPELAQVNSLMTASWTRGDKTYVLAGPRDDAFLKKYL